MWMDNTNDQWTATKDLLPESGSTVLALTTSGDLHILIYDSNLWWTPDHAMYVYFVPEFWKVIETTVEGTR